MNSALIEKNDSPGTDQAKGQRLSGRQCLIFASLLLVYVLQCLWFIGTQSLTCDEPAHMVAGLEALRDHKFEFLNDQPPLARMLFAIPLAMRGTQLHWFEGRWIDSTYPSPEAIAWTGRPVNVALGILLVILLWRTARRWFSDGAANFALALFAFSPGMIAHFSVMTIDGISVLLVFVAALQMGRWWRDRSMRQTLLLGLTQGLLLLAKFYTPPMFAVAVLLVLISRPGGWIRNPLAWKWRPAIVVCLVAGFVLWAGYLFHVSEVSFDQGHATVTFPNRGNIEGLTNRRTEFILPVPFNSHFHIYLPAAEYLEGVWLVKEHARFGHPTFLLGRMSRMGWNLYYPIAIALKWPTIVLLCALAGAILAIRRKILLPPEWWVIAIFPALLFAMAIFSSIQIGDRHILPLYPFFLLLAAGLWQWAREDRRWRVLLVAALVLNAGDVLRYAPDYLSYFNVFIKPDKTWTLLSDSNVDWGSGLIALQKYQQQHPREDIHMAYFGSVDPKIYGIRSAPLLPNTFTSGTVIVSPMYLTGHWLDDPKSYRWVLQYPCKAILNHTLYVFEVPAAPSSPR